MRHSLRFVFLWAVVGIAAVALCKSTPRKPWGFGKDYYVVFPICGTYPQPGGAIITSPSRQHVTATSSSGAVAQLSFTTPHTSQILTGVVHVESIPDKIDPRGATHIQSEEPISVIGQLGTTASKGTYTALPVTDWGTEYYVLGVAEGINYGNAFFPTFYSVAGITIIGQHEGTSVSITPTSNTAEGHVAGVPYSITLNAGDVYYITTAADPKGSVSFQAFGACEADFTGSHILSSSPVGVLTSLSYGSLPCGDQYCGDYGVEWLPPINQWDTSYVLAPSVPRYDNAPGDQVRIIFSQENTTLSVDEGNGPQVVGAFGAGQSFDYIRPFSGIHMTANHPFLPMNITVKAAGCAASVPGKEPWNFSMAMQVGERQWTDYAEFSGGYSSIAILDLVFRYADKDNIFVNGQPLTTLSPVVTQLPNGFAFARADINSNLTPVVLHGLNGATFTGTVFGHGTTAMAPGGSNEQPLTFSVAICSYAHPIAASSVDLHNDDVVAPRAEIINDNCGSWSVRAFDDNVQPLATGLADITLATYNASDTSFNVAFRTPPKFQYGDFETQCIVDVVNLAQPAQASLHIRDMAGNEFDTVLTYAPQRIDATPQVLDFGAVRVGESPTGSIVLINRSASPAVFIAMRLRYGASRHWRLLNPPTLPLTLAAGATDTVQFAYDAQSGSGSQCDDDSLMVTTCREFPVAALHACNKQPAISAVSTFFGCGTIDSLEHLSDTIDARPVAVVSVGGDTLHVTRMSLIGISPADVQADPTRDFTVVTDPPSVTAPWRIAPNDTMFVTVRSHPHHSGPRMAALVFTSDGGTTIQDTAFLSGCGVPPIQSSVAQRSPETPNALSLSAYPNPFGSSIMPSTTIVFTLSKRERVTIEVRSLLGELVATLVNETRDAGEHRVVFDGTSVRSGVYLYSISVGTKMETHAVAIVK